VLRGAESVFTLRFDQDIIAETTLLNPRRESATRCDCIFTEFHEDAVKHRNCRYLWAVL